MTRERIESLPDDDWRKRSPEFREPRLAEHLSLVERLQAVPTATARRPARRGRLDAPQSSRRRSDRRFRRADQVDPIAVAAGLELSDDDVAEITSA